MSYPLINGWAINTGAPLASNAVPSQRLAVGGPVAVHTAVFAQSAHPLAMGTPSLAGLVDIKLEPWSLHLVKAGPASAFLQQLPNDQVVTASGTRALRLGVPAVQREAIAVSAQGQRGMRLGQPLLQRTGAAHGQGAMVHSAPSVQRSSRASGVGALSMGQASSLQVLNLKGIELGRSGQVLARLASAALAVQGQGGALQLGQPAAATRSGVARQKQSLYLGCPSMERTLTC